MTTKTPDADPNDDMDRSRRWRLRLQRALQPSEDERALAGPPTSWIAITIAIAIPLVFLGLVLVAHYTNDVDFGDVSREPTVTLDGPPLTGIQSNVGVLIMWLAVGVSLFTFAVLRRLGSSKSARRFFLWGGLITAMLAIDDMFLVHDQLIYESTGLNDRRTFAVYALIIAAFVWLYRRVLLASSGVLFVTAVFMLGASLAVDQTSSLWGESPWRIFVEDGFKLLGLTFWSAYFIRRSYFAIVGTAAGSRSSS